MLNKQKTIKNTFSISGVGLHTGENCIIKFLPAEPNFGIKFQRIDLPDEPIIEASISNINGTSRGSRLFKNNVAIGTVEHVLAAIIGLDIDNILIQINATEVPILDGSSNTFIKELKKAEIIEQEAIKEYIEITEPFKYIDEEKNAEYIIIPDNKYSLTVNINYDSAILHHQYAELTDIKNFQDEIASCRTFVFLHELELLLNNNLIKGGDLSNAIVIVDREFSQEELDRIAKVFNKETVKVVNNGILNNLDLTYDNEPARHKLLDLVGDLALLGKQIKGKIIATRPGHSSNIKLGKEINKIYNKNKDIPKIDFSQTPLYNINAIKKLLPHRPPFLLVDKIYEMGEDWIVGIKNVTMNEPFFVGHFPDEPIMPGVLILEAMAQTGGILVLSSVKDPENYSTYFAKIDKVKFKQKVVPGDTLVFKLKYISPLRRGLATMKAKAYVNGKLVTEGEFMAQIIKTK